MEPMTFVKESYDCDICKEKHEGKYSVMFAIDNRIIGRMCSDCYFNGIIWASAKAYENRPRFKPIGNLVTHCDHRQDDIKS